MDRDLPLGKPDRKAGQLGKPKIEFSLIFFGY